MGRQLLRGKFCLFWTHGQPLGSRPGSTDTDVRGRNGTPRLPACRAAAALKGTRRAYFTPASLTHLLLLAESSAASSTRWVW